LVWPTVTGQYSGQALSILTYLALCLTVRPCASVHWLVCMFVYTSAQGSGKSTSRYGQSDIPLSGP